MQQVKEHISSKRHLLIVFISFVPFMFLSLLGSQFYFRHDDVSGLLWAKEYDQPLHHIFSTDPELNRFNEYPGLAGGWRPFGIVYLKLLWHIFGERAGPYHIIDGFIFMGAVFFLFRLSRFRSGLYVAAISCLMLFAAFHETMYGLFHIGYPILYLFQLAMIYFFWAYLHRRRWYHLVGMALFLWPSLSRQTTPIILTAILIAVLLDRHGRRAVFSIAAIPALAIIIAGFYIMTLTPSVGWGTTLSIFPDISMLIAFVSERFFYYGRILTSGVTGLIMLLFLGSGVCNHAARFLAERYCSNRLIWLWPPAVLLATLFALRMYPYGAYWLVFCIVYLFVFDAELRLPLAWAGASLLLFLNVRYYHNAYLLESGFGFAIAFGILAVRLCAPAASALKDRVLRYGKKTVAVGAGICVLVIVALVAVGSRTPLVSRRVNLIKISIDSNRNFHDLMNYMKHELPENTAVYELDEEQINATSLTRRFYSLEKRAARTKILNILHTNIMLKVLGRGDITIHSARELPSPPDREEIYFIVLNNFERAIAENEFELELMREFRGSIDSAAIYRVVRSSASRRSGPASGM